MRQLLILGFYCEVYRQEPRCRVYVNDVLLDEFDIRHSPLRHSPRKHVDVNDIQLNPNFFSQSYARIEKNTPFLKCIDFDDHDAKEADLRIEIQNNDNNYANGFMNKYTCVMLNQIFLLSKKLLNRIDYLKNNWKLSLKNYHIHTKRDIDMYYSNQKNKIFQNFAVEMMLNFPDIIQKQYSVEEIKPYYNNWQDLPQLCQDNPSYHWIGSSGYFHSTLKKKFGFWRHKTDQRKGRWRLGSIDLVKHFYDKYLQYEDQRSSNT